MALPLVPRPNPRAGTRVNERVGVCVCVYPPFPAPPFFTLPHPVPKLPRPGLANPFRRSVRLPTLPHLPLLRERVSLRLQPPPRGPHDRAREASAPARDALPAGSGSSAAGWRHALDRHSAAFWPPLSPEALPQTKSSLTGIARREGAAPPRRTEEEIKAKAYRAQKRSLLRRVRCEPVQQWELHHTMARSREAGPRRIRRDGETG